MPILFYVFIFLFGTIIGSFLNCLIWRLHKEEGIWGRSYCPKCRKQIAWYDNIPILSFILLKGKCRHCHKKISRQYPVVELITGILFLLSYYQNIPSYSLITNPQSLITIIRDWFIISIMIIIFIYDLRWYLILDVITLPAIVIIFLVNLFLGLTWQYMLISGIIGSSFFLIQFVISKGKWIGGGDIRLGLLMGVILGWPMVIVAIFLAYFLGSLIGVGLIVTKKKDWGSKVPFGVFLSFATIIVLFWGEKILNWYLNLFNFL